MSDYGARGKQVFKLNLICCSCNPCCIWDLPYLCLHMLLFGIWCDSSDFNWVLQNFLAKQVGCCTGLKTAVHEFVPKINPICVSSSGAQAENRTPNPPQSFCILLSSFVDL